MRLKVALFLVLAATVLLAAPALAGGRLVFAGLRMDPTDEDARRYSRPGWGAGVEAVAPLPISGNMVAGVFGFDFVNLMTRTVKFREPSTGLRIEQQTHQDYMRLYTGGQLGSHSRGFLRPYVGVNVALVLYGISTDVVVPDDSDRENEIRQSLRDEYEAAFGWDANAGLDLNFNVVSVDVGVRALHAYGLPQQLGADAVTIQPGYVEYKVGVGVPFSAFTGR
jgi:hypothetical protein